MKARDIMTAKVHTVRADTSVAEIARLMTAERISGVPVLSDKGEPMGMVSETDLLHRAETGTTKRRKWWIGLFLDKDTLARDFIKSHGLKAADVMSRYVISVRDEASLAEVADLLDTNNLKRVPVLRDGKLAGIITRGDLVRALANPPAAAPRQAPAPSTNADLQRLLMQRIDKQPWVASVYIHVIVTDDSVELRGFVGTDHQRKALDILVRELAGPRRIDDQLVVGVRWLHAAA